MSAPTVRRILFPTDYSRCAEGAYRHAAYLADRFSATLHVLHVAGADPDDASSIPIGGAGTGHLTITMADVYEDLGLPAPEPEPDYDLLELVEIVETEVDASPPAEAILDAIHDDEIDLVVMGTHGRTGWRRGVLGSVTEAVLRRAPCPVLTVRPLDAEVSDRAWPPSRVLLAVDPAFDSDPDAPPTVAPAMRWAAQLAAAYRASLDLLYVTPPTPLTSFGSDRATQERTRLRSALGRLGTALCDEVNTDLRVDVDVRVGAPADTIRTVAAENGTHLVVAGTHGWQGVKRAVLGSVAESVLRTAECPVLIVPNDLNIEIPDADTKRTSAVA
ncbi:MAG: universal stress protein [Rubricoccaceae bacterium]